MASLYLLVPMGVLIVFGVIGLFLWAVAGGQFERLDEIAARLPDDEA